MQRRRRQSQRFQRRFQRPPALLLQAQRPTPSRTPLPRTERSSSTRGSIVDITPGPALTSTATTTDSYVDIQVGASTRRALFGSGTTIWRGGPVSPEALEVRDDLLVHVDPGAQIVRDWANLDRLQGQVVGPTSHGFEIQPYKTGAASLELLIPSGTPAVNPYTGSAVSTQLQTGAVVDVAGLGLDGAISAALMAVVEPGGAPPEPVAATGDTSSGVVQVDATTCRHFYRGIASWYTCPKR